MYVSCAGGEIIEETIDAATLKYQNLFLEQAALRICPCSFLDQEEDDNLCILSGKVRKRTVSHNGIEKDFYIGIKCEICGDGWQVMPVLCSDKKQAKNMANSALRNAVRIIVDDRFFSKDGLYERSKRARGRKGKKVFTPLVCEKRQELAEYVDKVLDSITAENFTDVYTDIKSKYRKMKAFLRYKPEVKKEKNGFTLHPPKYVRVGNEDGEIEFIRYSDIMKHEEEIIEDNIAYGYMHPATYSPKDMGKYEVKAYEELTQKRLYLRGNQMTLLVWNYTTHLYIPKIYSKLDGYGYTDEDSKE